MNESWSAKEIFIVENRNTESGVEVTSPACVRKIKVVSGAENFSTDIYMLISGELNDTFVYHAIATSRATGDRYYRFDTFGTQQPLRNSMIIKILAANRSAYILSKINTTKIGKRPKEAARFVRRISNATSEVGVAHVRRNLWCKLLRIDVRFAEILK